MIRYPNTPEAKRAISEYWAAVESGEIARPKACETCGAPGPVEAAIHDYAKPTSATHMCRVCCSRLSPREAFVLRMRFGAVPKKGQES